MKKILFFFIIISFFKAQAIINAEIDLESKIPSAVFIWSLRENKVQFRCSGTIIAPDVVITEASCIYDKNDEKRGDTFVISHSLKYHYKKPLAYLLQTIIGNVRSDVKHPNENLILLFLNQAVFIEPAILLQPNETHYLINTETAFITGWGFNTAPRSKKLSDKIAYYFLDAPDDRQLGTKYIGTSHLGSQTERFIELGYQPDDALACVGDEGGPIMISLPTSLDRSDRLIGIISSNQNLDFCLAPTCGLRLDKHIDFFEEELKRACQKGIRSWCNVQGLIPPNYVKSDDIKVTPKPLDLSLNHISDVPPNSPVPILTPQQSEKPPGFSDSKMLFSSVPNQEPQKQKRNLSIKMKSISCGCNQTHRNY